MKQFSTRQLGRMKSSVTPYCVGPLAHQELRLAHHALDPFAIHRPALGPQPPREARTPPGHFGGGEVTQPRDQRRHGRATGLVSHGCPVLTEITVGATRTIRGGRHFFLERSELMQIGPVDASIFPLPATQPIERHPVPTNHLIRGDLAGVRFQDRHKLVRDVATTTCSDEVLWPGGR